MIAPTTVIFIVSISSMATRQVSNDLIRKVFHAVRREEKNFQTCRCRQLSITTFCSHIVGDLIVVEIEFKFCSSRFNFLHWPNPTPPATLRPHFLFKVVPRKCDVTRRVPAHAPSRRLISFTSHGRTDGIRRNAGMCDNKFCFQGKFSFRCFSSTAWPVF